MGKIAYWGGLLVGGLSTGAALGLLVTLLGGQIPISPSPAPTRATTASFQIDPVNYGAGDSVADNSAAINAAVTAAAGYFNGATVRIHSPAHWAICKPIIWKPKVSFLLDKDVDIFACGAFGAQTATFTATADGSTSVLTVNSITSGTINVGDWISGPIPVAGRVIPSGTYIEADATTAGTPCGGSACTGSGGAGTYNLSQATLLAVGGSGFSTNAPGLSSMVQIPAGAANRVTEREWSGGQLFAANNVATAIFDLQDFERLTITRTLLADSNHAYVEVGNAAQSATAFELEMFANRIDRLSVSHAPRTSVGIESVNQAANIEIHDNRIIGTYYAISGQLADWSIAHNHEWTDPAGSRGDMLNCVNLTDYGALIEGDQCDIGTVGVAEGATLNAFNINPTHTGYISQLIFNRINSQYGADNQSGTAAVNLGANAQVYAYGNVIEFTTGHRFKNDWGGTITSLNAFGTGIANGAVVTRTTQDLALRAGALFVGGARSVMPSSLSGNNGAVLDFGGNGGGSIVSLYGFDYSSSTGRQLDLNKNGGTLTSSASGPANCSGAPDGSFASTKGLVTGC